MLLLTLLLISFSLNSPSGRTVAIFFDSHPPPLYITGYKAEITYIYNFSSGSLKWWAEVVVVEDIVVEEQGLE